MDPAYLMLLEFKTHGLQMLDKWVSDAVREDLHLDFKRKRHPETWRLSSDDKRNFSRALSGFANSDSGLIIWGIDAPGSGESLRTKVPISSVRGFAEALDSLVSRAVNPNVSGVENFVIFEDESQDLGYVITYVPRSTNPPHRAESEGLKHYYKRYGESFQVAEHYEVEYMFGKRRFPELGVFWSVDLDLPHEAHIPNQVPCKLRIGITNQGKAIASYVCLRLRFPHQSAFKLEPFEKGDLIHYSEPMNASRPHHTLITARAMPGLVVYPADYLFFFNFSFVLPRVDLLRNRLPKFEVFYDLFAADFKAVSNEKVSITGKKIAEKIKRKVDIVA